MGAHQKVLWNEYFTTIPNMIKHISEMINNSLAVANELDKRLLTKAFITGRQNHADIIVLSIRQIMLALKFLESVHI